MTEKGADPVDEPLDNENSGPLVVPEQTVSSRRRNQVKVLLNDDELAQLDWMVLQMGSDRASVMRYLLSAFKSKGDLSNSNSTDVDSDSTDKHDITRVNISPFALQRQPIKPLIRLFQPRLFDEVPVAIDCLREGCCVVINLTLMTPDAAQRAVDFVAGGTFFCSGYQERVGESIFLFASKEFDISYLDKKKDAAHVEPLFIASNDENSNMATQQVDRSHNDKLETPLDGDDSIISTDPESL